MNRPIDLWLWNYLQFAKELCTIRGFSRLLDKAWLTLTELSFLANCCITNATQDISHYHWQVQKCCLGQTFCHLPNKERHVCWAFLRLSWYSKDIMLQEPLNPSQCFPALYHFGPNVSTDGAAVTYIYWYVSPHCCLVFRLKYKSC